jgi:hypothetical protein
MGAADLIANGKQVAVIDYHTGDDYQNTASVSRLSYYGLTGTPTAWFDGGSSVVGGNHTVSMYPQYLPKYNQRINVLSSFTIDIQGTNSGMIDYELNITINKVASTTATNMVMHVVVTENDIQESWQGMTELNHVERLMVPNQNGTTLDFSGGDILEFTKNFSMNPDWVIDNCEVIVFIQNLANKEVLQASLKPLSDFVTTNTNDAAILNAVAPQTVCMENFAPKIKIGNFGLDNLTSVDISMQMNGGSPVIYTWNGNLAFLENEIVQLPEITFSIQETNTFSVTCSNPNGQLDQFASNNMKTIQIDEALNVTTPVSLALKLDSNPDETTWELVTSSGEAIYSGGPYSTPNQFIVQSFVLTDPDCYTFKIYDTGGDGLTGTGMYKLAYQGSTIFAEGAEFGFEDQVEFGIGLTGIESNLINKSFEIYPNPMSDQTTVSFSLDQAQTIEFRLFNSMGSVVYQSGLMEYSAGKHNFVLESNGLTSGIYYLEAKIGSGSCKQKLVIN